MKRLLSVFFAVLLALPSSAGISGNNPFVFGKSRITIITPTLFRIEYAEDARFIDAPTLFAYDRTTLLDPSQIEVTALGGDRYVIRTSALSLEYWDNGYPFGEVNLRVKYMLDGKEATFTNRGIYNRNLGSSVETLDKQDGPIPMNDGLLARSGWYIIDDERADLLKDGWIEARNAPGHLQDQYCFVYGNDYKAALADLGAISGRVPMTRKYIHGVWYCRYWDYTAQDFLQIADDYDKNGFPLDNMVLDMAWHENDATDGIGGSGRLYWTGYDWNRELIPDPAALIGELHGRGLSVSLNDHPHDGIRKSESCYEDFTRAMEVPSDSVLLFNLADRKYMENFFKYSHQPHNDMGVDFWWLDWQQNFIYPRLRGLETSSLKWINELYWRYSEQQEGKRGCSFSRWAGWGDQRHPVQFSGDAHITWPMLAFEVKLSSYGAASGCYYWLHDIGGFKGEPDPEMNVRWTQFGATSAALRIHSTKSSKLDRRPWLGTEQEVEALRKAYEMRSCLMPYIYSSVREVHETMAPLNRPMFYEYPTAEEAFGCPQEYLFGDLLLCAPITSPGTGHDKTASQNVWFPAGEAWYDWFTGERIDGGCTRDISKPLDEFPIYIKGGWLLPMQPFTLRPATEQLTSLMLKVRPSASDCDNTYYLYEDDGISDAYKDGAYAKTALRYVQEGSQALIEIIPDGGTFDGQPKKREYVIEYMRMDGSIGECRIKASKIDKKVSCKIKL